MGVARLSTDTQQVAHRPLEGRHRSSGTGAFPQRYLRYGAQTPAGSVRQQSPTAAAKRGDSQTDHARRLDMLATDYDTRSRTRQRPNRRRHRRLRGVAGGTVVGGAPGRSDRQRAGGRDDVGVAVQLGLGRASARGFRPRSRRPTDARCSGRTRPAPPTLKSSWSPGVVNGHPAPALVDAAEGCRPPRGREPWTRRVRRNAARFGQRVLRDNAHAPCSYTEALTSDAARRPRLDVAGLALTAAPRERGRGRAGVRTGRRGAAPSPARRLSAPLR